MNGAAFFDLDRTLVPINTGPLYVKWKVRQRQMGMRELARASWWSLQYTLGVLDAEAVSRAAVATLMGIDEAAYRAELATWVRDEVVPKLSRPARDELDRRQREGRVCALLTSTSPYVADPIASHLGLEHVLSSRIAVRDGRFTGEVEAPLCYGPGKVARAKAWASERGIDLAKSAFYTDSISDLPMLEVVGEPRVINPDPRLRAVALRRRWPIEWWT